MSTVLVRWRLLVVGFEERLAGLSELECLSITAMYFYSSERSAMGFFWEGFCQPFWHLRSAQI